jgi:hypothetical protein
MQMLDENHRQRVRFVDDHDRAFSAALETVGKALDEHVVELVRRGIPY